MSIRKKTRKRLLILLTIVVLLGGTIGGLFWYRDHRRDTRAKAARARGVAAFERGDYRKALSQIATALRRFPEDAEALRMLARARLKVEEPSGKHLLLAMQLYERALALAPGHEPSQRQLMEIYRDLNRNLEARKIAEELLVSNPQDEEVLWTLAVVQQRTGEFQRAFDTIERYLEQDRGSLRGHLLAVNLLAQLERNHEQILTWAQKVSRDHSEVPGFGLVLAHAKLLTEDREGAKAGLEALVDTAIEDEMALTVLAQDLRQVNLFDQALVVLEKVAARSVQSPLHLPLARRDYETGRFDAVVERVNRLEEQGRFMEPELAALRVLALAGKDEAPAAREALAGIISQEDPEAAGAWRNFLTGIVLGDAKDIAKKLELAQATVQKLPDSPYPRFHLAQVWEEAYEPVLAIEQYGAAIQRSPGWIEPLARCGALLARTGRVAWAAALTEMAHSIDPEDPRLRRIWATVNARQLPRMTQKNLESLREELVKLEDPRFAPLTVLTLARMNLREDAAALVKKFLGDPEDVPAGVLLRLALASDAAELGLGDTCLETYLEVSGPTVEFGVVRAMRTAREQGPDAALAELHENRTGSTDPVAADWDVARIQLLDAKGGEEALEECRQIADRYENDLGVQNAIVAGQLPWKDPALVGRAIQRIRKTVGEAGLSWKLARARWLMLDDNSPQVDIQEALTLLQEVTAKVPDVPRFRILLAMALERSEDLTGAVDQLDQVIGLGGDRVETLLHQAELLRRIGDYEEAEAKLRIVAAIPDAPPAARREAAKRLLSVAEFEAARDALGDLPDESEEGRRERLILLAQAEERLGQRDVAEGYLKELLEDPASGILNYAAAFYERAGRPEKANEMLERLSETELEPWRQELVRADHARLFGRMDVAFSHYEAALAKAPEERRIWFRLLSAAAQSAETENFSKYLERALEIRPEDPVLAAVHSAIEDAGGTLNSESARRLVMSALGNPEVSQPCLEAVRILTDEESAVRPEATARKISALARENPKNASLQIVAMELLCELENVDEVVTMARRMEQGFPWSSQPSQFLARVYALTGRFTEALPPATEWARREGGREPFSQTFLASIHLELGNAWKAEQILTQFLDDPRVSPTLERRIRGLLWKSWIDQDRGEAALQEYRKFLTKGPEWREVGLRLGSAILEDVETAATWLDTVGADIAPEEFQARVILMNAWGRLAARAESEDLPARKLLTLLEGFGIHDKDLSPNLNFAVGSLWETAGDVGNAEEFYRRSLEDDPEHVLAANNLAMVLLRRGETEEALRLARKVVERFPDNPEFRDTLAEVLHGNEKWDEAIQQLERCQVLDPENPRWPIAKLEMLLKTPDRRDEARSYLEEANQKWERPLSEPWEKRIRRLERQMK